MSYRQGVMLNPSLFTCFTMSSTRMKIGGVLNDLSEDDDSRNSLCISETDLHKDPESFRQYKIDIFPWEPQRFVRHQLFDKKRRNVRMHHLQKLELVEDEKNGILSTRMISCCLTYLDRSPYYLKYALCKCNLERKNLIDISAIREYHYIQYLNISSNKLTTLDALGEMPYLQYLNASNNDLEELLDFKAPLFLSYVDYSHNKIKKIPDLNEFWSIYHLNLSNNDIEEISGGLLSLKYLVYLNLSHNNISCIKNLNNLRLETLLLTNNKICACEVDEPTATLESLIYLKVINMSFNKINNLKFLKGCSNLEIITMTNNFIDDLMEIYYLQDHSHLRTLNLRGNDISEMPLFVKTCLRTIKTLLNLNGEDITAEMKIDVLTKAHISPELPASVKKMHLLLLECINIPNSGNNLYEIDQPRTKVLIIVGPPASNKKHFARKLVRHNGNQLVLGVSHTTRPKRSTDIEGIDHYFVKHDEFTELIRKGEFIAMSEFNDYLYGISHSELVKAGRSVIVFSCDLVTALIMKMTRVQLTMVLALPRDRQLHLDWMKEHYLFEQEIDAIISEIHVVNCPLKILSSLLKQKSDHAYTNKSNLTDFNFLGSVTYINKNEYASDQSIETNNDTIWLDVSTELPLQSINDNIIKSKESDEPGNASPDCRSPIRKNVTYDKEISFLINNHKVITFTDNSTQRNINNNEFSRESLLELQDQLNWIYKKAARLHTSHENFGNINHDKKCNMKTNEHCVCFQNNIICSKTCACGKNMFDIEHVEAVKTLIREITDIETNILSREPNERKFFSYHKFAEDKTAATEFVIKEREQIESSNKTYSSILRNQNNPNNYKDSELVHETRNVSVVISEEPKKVQMYIKYEPTETTFNNTDDCDMQVDSYGQLCRNQMPHFKPRLSISTNDVMQLLGTHLLRDPLLSVLSEEGVHDEAITRYSTIPNRIDQVITETLQPFLESIIQTREELLELHWENPGIFYSLIFTDDEQTSLDILKTAIKNMRHRGEDLSDKCENVLHNDIVSNEIVKNRLKALNVWKFNNDYT